MPLTSRYLASRLEDDVLVLSITEPNLRGYPIAKALRQELLKEISNHTKVVLDFHSVLSFTSEAFRPLLSLRRHVEENGGQLRWHPAITSVGQVFNLSLV